MIYIDGAAGSKKLPDHFRRAGTSTPFMLMPSNSLQTDFEFLGHTAFGPTPIGGEYKISATGDTFDSMRSGRLTGTQLPKLVRAYPYIRYIVIEGCVRGAKDGVLELRKYGEWQPAAGKDGRGWTLDEYRNRIESIEDAWSWPHVEGRTRVVETYDEFDTARFIDGRYRYWSKPYEEHGSARQQDRVGELSGWRRPADVLLNTTSELPLVYQWAERINGIGSTKATFVAEHFKSGYRLAHSTEEEWALIEYKEQVRSGPGKGQLRIKRFGKEMIRKFVEQIRKETVR